jgi:glycerate dehydrogenase
MRIVVLDGFTLNPGDLSWKGIEELGECVVYDRTAAEDTVQRADGAEIVLTNKTVLSADIIERLAKLQYIGVLATGYNIVDAEAARKRGIPVTNVPTYGTDSVAQMVFAHLLNLTQNVASHARTVSNGRWCSSPDFCYWDTPLVELWGLTMGIIGFGRIGQATARLASAFGMKVIAYDITLPPRVETTDGRRMTDDGLSSIVPRLSSLVSAARLRQRLRRRQEARAEAGQAGPPSTNCKFGTENHNRTVCTISAGCEMVGLEDVFRLADVISLHCPLTPQTENLVNEQRLALMKKTAFLINTSRGPLINERDLANALNNGRIAGAGLDVLAIEPPDEQNPLLKAKNCYITPHIAWATRAARERLLRVAVDNVAAFLAGRAKNVVNGVRP